MPLRQTLIFLTFFLSCCGFLIMAGKSVFQNIRRSFSAPAIPKRSKKKIREHVNPLSAFFQTPKVLPEDWIQTNYETYANRPMIIDVGCSRGEWGLNTAVRFPHLNILGLEIRDSVYSLAMKAKSDKNLTNIHFLNVNANVDLRRIIKDLDSLHIPLQTVAFQFPDPQFKKRYKKRRVVNAPLVEMLAQELTVSTSIFLQTDILDLCEDMVSHFDNHPCFSLAEGYHPTLLHRNPSYFDVPTERELYVAGLNLPIYRAVFVRNDLPYCVAPVRPEDVEDDQEDACDGRDNLSDEELDDRILNSEITSRDGVGAP